MKFYIGGIIMLTFLLACESDVELEIAIEDDRLVLNASLEAGKSPEIYVYKSQNPLLSFTDRSILDNAEVELVDQNGNKYPLRYIDELKEMNNYPELFSYYGDTSLLIDEHNSYSIQINYNDLESASAHTKIIPPIHENDVDFDYIHISSQEPGIGLGGNESYPNLLLIDFNKKHESHQYLSLILEYDLHVIDENQDTVGFSISMLPLTSSSLKSQQGVYNQLIVDISELSHGQNTIRLNTASVISSWHYVPEYDFYSVLKLNLQIIDENTMLYYSSLQYNTITDPFQEPTPVYSNIEGGYGIFGSTSSIRLSKELKIEQ